MPADEFFRSGLAGAVLSDKSVDGTHGNSHIKAVQGVQPAEGLFEASYFNGIYSTASFIFYDLILSFECFRIAFVLLKKCYSETKERDCQNGQSLRCDSISYYLSCHHFGRNKSRSSTRTRSELV
jgi:hypothetical protein